MNTLLIEQGIEVVEHICGRVTILRYEDMHPSHSTHQRRRIERKSPADQILEMDGDALFSMFLYQLREGLRPLNTLQNIIYTLQNAEFFLSIPLRALSFFLSLSPFSATVQSTEPQTYQGNGHQPYPDSGRPRSSVAPYIATSSGNAATTLHHTGTMPHKD